MWNPRVAQIHRATWRLFCAKVGWARKNLCVRVVHVAQLAPRPQPVAAAPTVLPSSVIAGIAASKALSSTAGGRKMMQDAHNAPPCCNTHTVKQGDSLQSIAATYGASTTGPAILQVVTHPSWYIDFAGNLPGTSARMARDTQAVASCALRLSFCSGSASSGAALPCLLMLWTFSFACDGYEVHTWPAK